MKKILTMLLALSAIISSTCFGTSAYSGRYVPDGMDADYYTMLADASEDMQLGSLSAKYESNGNPATISAGNDTGGVSYGAYQFSSRYGVPLTFAEWCISSGEGVAAGERLKAAYELDNNTYGENFNAEWKKIAQESPESFLLLQHNFTKARFYDVVVDKLEQQFEGFDVDDYTIALKNVIWSRAVQNGANNDVIRIAFENLGGFENQPEDVLIKAIYKQASKLVDDPPHTDSVQIQKSSAEKYGIDVETVEGKYLYYHSRNSSDIQVAVYKRLAINEVGEALEMYVAAGGTLTPEDPETPDDPTQPGEGDTQEPSDPADPPSDGGEGGSTEEPVPDEPSSGILAVFEAILRFFELVIDFFLSFIG